jgi:hypothetical protein
MLPLGVSGKPEIEVAHPTKIDARPPQPQYFDGYYLNHHAIKIGI